MLLLFHFTSCFRNIFFFPSLSFCRASSRKHELFFARERCFGLFFIFSFQTFRNWRNGHSLAFGIFRRAQSRSMFRSVFELKVRTPFFLQIKNGLMKCFKNDLLELFFLNFLINISSGIRSFSAVMYSKGPSISWDGVKGESLHRWR